MCLCNTDCTQTGKENKVVTHRMILTNDDMHVYQEIATVLLHMRYKQAKNKINHPDSGNLKFQCNICSISEEKDLTCNCFFQLLRCKFNTLCCLNFLVLHIRILRIKNKNNEEYEFVTFLFNWTKCRENKYNLLVINGYKSPSNLCYITTVLNLVLLVIFKIKHFPNSAPLL